MNRQIIFYVEGYAELEFINEIIGPLAAFLSKVITVSHPFPLA
ncbi:MAG: hypothetical protein V2B19_09740 [Pseudomonadota bacterium]